MRIADWKTQMTQQQGRVRRRLALFRADDEGSLVIFSLFLIIAMLIIGGLGVDLMLYETQRTRLQATLDRAILAAAHPGQNNDRKAVVLSYFKSAGLEDFIEEEDVTVVETVSGSEVSAEAKMHVDPLLLQFVGINGFEAVAQGAAAQAANLIEVSLVVDVSGSMDDTSTSGRSKIVELREAAIQFSNLLLCNPSDPTTSTNCTKENKDTSITLVPYSSQVTVGQKVLSQFTLTDAQNESYCATFLDDDFKDVAIDPSVAIRQSAKYYTYPGNTYQFNPNGWSEPSDKWWDTWWSCFTAEWREIVPFEDSPTDLKTKINALGAWGGTAIHLGMKWGVGLLHHDAQSVVSNLVASSDVDGAFAGRPFNSDIVNSTKIVVLMTDGKNSSRGRLKDGYRTGPSPFWSNSSSSVLSIYNSATNQYHWYNRPNGAPSVADHPYGEGTYRKCQYHYYYGNQCWNVDEPGTANQMDYQTFWAAGYTLRIFDDYPWLGEPGIYTSNSDDDDGDGIANVDELLLDQCTAAKDAKIKIYTIELETGGGSSGGSILRDCATNETHYFKVDGVDLVETFSTIGQDIAKLRLTN